MGCLFLEGIPEFEIREGLVFITAIDINGEPQRVCARISDFRKGSARVTKLLAGYDAAGSVIPMRKPSQH